jgi:3-oxoacyl-[acyl-carrier-protein] synthase II
MAYRKEYPISHTGRHAVITGLGIIAPNGNCKDEFWDSLVHGRSGISSITSFDTAGFTTKFAGEVKNIEMLDRFNGAEARRLPRFARLAVIAAQEAMSDAGLGTKNAEAEMMDIVAGVSINALEIIERQVVVLHEKGPSRMSPFTVMGALPNAAAGLISVELGIKGRAATISTGCSSSLNAIGHAYELIRYGKRDRILCGGAEAPVTPSIMGAFCASRSLSKRNDDPGKASRPFDRFRDGYIISEGAAFFVMESLESAMKRNAVIYAEVVGYGNTSEALSMYKMDDTGMEAARAMAEAVRDAGIDPKEVDYINAHGSSSLVSDIRETRAIKLVFGGHSEKLKISSVKSMLGHPLGASGGFQTAATILAGIKGYVPPTINYEAADPECDLDYVPNESIRVKFRTAVINSFGLGGNNASLVIRIL